MLDINTLKASNDTNIRKQTVDDSITPDIVASALDNALTFTSEQIGQVTTSIPTTVNGLVPIIDFLPSNAFTISQISATHYAVNLNTDYIKSLISGNQPPVVVLGGNMTITLPTNSVTLVPQSVTDSDGTIASVQWTISSGPTGYTFSSPTQNQTTLSGLTQGTYVVRLTATDDKGASSYQESSVIVNPAPAPTNPTISSNFGSSSWTEEGFAAPVGSQSNASGVASASKFVISSTSGDHDLKTNITGLSSGTSYMLLMDILAVGVTNIQVVVLTTPDYNQVGSGRFDLAAVTSDGSLGNSITSLGNNFYRLRTKIIGNPATLLLALLITSPTTYASDGSQYVVIDSNISVSVES